MKAYRPLPYEHGKIMCACGDDSCYKAIEFGADEIFFYEDASDSTAKVNVIDLPKGIALCQMVEVDAEKAIASLSALVDLRLGALAAENEALKKKIALLERYID